MVTPPRPARRAEEKTVFRSFHPVIHFPWVLNIEHFRYNENEIL